jgi:formiminotetrahydrofolate cyclodeaminase
MNWMDMNLKDFQTALASSSPTPGGGTASAIALGQAASLAVMVCDLTLGNERWKDGWSVAERVQLTAIPLLHRSGILANEDSDAFDEVMASFKLPKNNDSEVESRRAAIRAATLKAASVPYETARLATDLLVMLPELAQKGNANAVSDVGVAGLLASAASKGAVFNVEINLESLPENMGADIRSGLPDVKERTKTASRAVMEAVRARMSN